MSSSGSSEPNPESLVFKMQKARLWVSTTISCYCKMKVVSTKVWQGVLLAFIVQRRRYQINATQSRPRNFLPLHRGFRQGCGALLPFPRPPSAYTSSSHWILRKGISWHRWADVEVGREPCEPQIDSRSGMDFMNMRRMNNALATAQHCRLK